jgi:DNA-binding XRE family transcriptional regulator
MFRNLEAEQARNGFTNQTVAIKLGISRVSYEKKKKTGKFTTFEIKSLCRLFKKSFDYLFATDDEQPKKAG